MRATFARGVSGVGGKSHGRSAAWQQQGCKQFKQFLSGLFSHPREPGDSGTATAVVSQVHCPRLERFVAHSIDPDL